MEQHLLLFELLLEIVILYIERLSTERGNLIRLLLLALSICYSTNPLLTRKLLSSLTLNIHFNLIGSL